MLIAEGFQLSVFAQLKSNYWHFIQVLVFVSYYGHQRQQLCL